MLEQFLKSIMVYFNNIEPVKNVYIQSIPKGVEYPCYPLNQCDIVTEPINSYYFINNITLYIRAFDRDEVQLKNKIFNLINQIYKDYRKIPVLNEDGSNSGRYIRLEDIESKEIRVDENETYCIEINFTFDTTHEVNVAEFEILRNVDSKFI